MALVDADVFFWHRGMAFTVPTRRTEAYRLGHGCAVQQRGRIPRIPTGGAAIGFHRHHGVFDLAREAVQWGVDEGLRGRRARVRRPLANGGLPLAA